MSTIPAAASNTATTSSSYPYPSWFPPGLPNYDPAICPDEWTTAGCFTYPNVALSNASYNNYDVLNASWWSLETNSSVTTIELSLRINDSDGTSWRSVDNRTVAHSGWTLYDFKNWPGSISGRLVLRFNTTDYAALGGSYLNYAEEYYSSGLAFYNKSYRAPLMWGLGGSNATTTSQSTTTAPASTPSDARPSTGAKSIQLVTASSAIFTCLLVAMLLST